MSTFVLGIIRYTTVKTTAIRIHGKILIITVKSGEKYSEKVPGSCDVRKNVALLDTIKRIGVKIIIVT